MDVNSGGPILAIVRYRNRDFVGCKLTNANMLRLHEVCCVRGRVSQVEIR